MNILLCLIAAILGSEAAQSVDDGIKEWTNEKIDAIFANASRNTTDSTPVLVASHNYNSETHHVTTDDGYVLEMHRISGSPTCPPANGKPIVFLMHGMLCSSASWVILGPERGLGYMMADAGYDVWMGNARGNIYSRKHIPKVSRKKFWNFSWHEIGYYDIPVMIDYVLDKTGQKQVVYIGHSQGTSSFWVMTSMKPEYNEKIKAMFALAPVAYSGNVMNPLLKPLSYGTAGIKAFADLIGVYEFLPSPRFIRKLRALLCANDVLAQAVCENIIFIIGGFDRPQLDVNLLPMIFGHFPAGCSINQLAHYGQLVESYKFRQYDFGTMKNKIIYGSATPPDYNLSSITAPVHLYYTGNDWLSNVKDVTQLNNELANSVQMVRVPYAWWDHFDYIWGKDARSLVYQKILDTLRESYDLTSSCS